MAAGEVAELQQLEEMLNRLHAFQNSLGDWAPAQLVVGAPQGAVQVRVKRML